jgi:hypothetical protein
MTNVSGSLCPAMGERVFAQKPPLWSDNGHLQGGVNRSESTDLGQDHGNTLQPVFPIEVFWRLAV